MEQFNSTENQEIKRNFVYREVHANVTLMVEDILSRCYNQKDPLFDYDDIINFYYYEDLNQEQYTDDSRTIQLNNWRDELDRIPDDTGEEAAEFQQDLESKIESLESSESIPSEIYEWWIVSDFLADQLEAAGECLLTCGYTQIWGRKSTGQAIYLDPVISEICYILKLLSGQPNQRLG
ncbi:hypothetical protein [Niabella ginsengisoli]|uniref:Uncharacterized protein n=1 Tax=Niabella ginsengisoli TaxID=522298 RepID=A0ABS9SI20_9BACT|nr:hypothetical protein [Niabella ginsengisoli]MCH5598014.1 hypothetical protein [Niabella ginsengisoli]